MSVGRFFAGFVVGGTLGAVIGVLLAPQPGEETRKQLSEMSKEVANTSTEKYQQAEESLKELQSKADVVMSDIQQKGDELLGKVQELINKEKSE